MDLKLLVFLLNLDVFLFLSEAVSSSLEPGDAEVSAFINILNLALFKHAQKDGEMFCTCLALV